MLAIIQARMSSRRLKGKFLKLINKKTLLECVFKNISRSKKVSRIIIATSITKEDEQILEFCKKKKFECLRGSLNNVYSRFVDVIKLTKAPSFIRITADSPFIDPSLIDKGIKLYNSNKYDMITNTFPRSFPKGQSFSIYNSKTFLKNFKKIKKKNDKEHITPYFYENSKKFKIKNISNYLDYSYLNTSVDTKADLNKAKKVIKRLSLKKNENFLLNLVKLYQ